MEELFAAIGIIIFAVVVRMIIRGTARTVGDGIADSVIEQKRKKHIEESVYNARKLKEILPDWEYTPEWEAEIREYADKEFQIAIKPSRNVNEAQDRLRTVAEMMIAKSKADEVDPQMWLTTAIKKGMREESGKGMDVTEIKLRSDLLEQFFKEKPYWKWKYENQSELLPFDYIGIPITVVSPEVMTEQFILETKPEENSNPDP